MHTEKKGRRKEDPKRFSKCEAFLPIIKLLRDETSTAREKERKKEKKGKRRNVKCKEICNGKEFQLLPIYVHLAFDERTNEKKSQASKKNELKKRSKERIK